MEQYIKNRIYLVIGIILFIIFFMWLNSHFNNDLDECKHSIEVKERFYYNTTCERFETRFACQRVDYSKLYAYCETTYPGGYWI